MNVFRYTRHLAQGVFVLFLSLAFIQQTQAQCGDFQTEPLPTTDPVNIPLNLTNGGAAPLDENVLLTAGFTILSGSGCVYEVASSPSGPWSGLPNFDCTDVTSPGTYITLYLRVNGGGGPSSPANVRELHITVTDNIFPTITCPAPAPVMANAACQYVFGAGTLAPSIVDNCPSVTYVWTSNGATISSGIGSADGATHPYNKGTTTVTYTVSDASGNTATCSFMVTVNDNTPPTLTCPTPANPYSADGDCVWTGAGLALTNALVNDNCATDAQLIATLTNNLTGMGDLNGYDFPLGTTNVTYTITDGTNPAVNCNFSITVIDVTYPSITCPVNTTVDADDITCDYTIDPMDTSFDVVATDNCTPDIALAISNDYDGQPSLAGQTFPYGTTTVTWAVADGAGNNTNCLFDLTVTDNTAPLVYFDPADGSGDFDPYPDSSFYQINSNNCFAAVTIEQPNYVITDPGYPCLGPVCSNFSVSDCFGYTIQRVPNPYIDGFAPAFNPNDPINRSLTVNFPVGITYVQYLITDQSANANTSVITIKVEVIENDDPIPACKSSITAVLTSAGTVAITGALLDNGSTDNCGIVSYLASPSSYTCSSIGTQVAQLTVQDAAGNTATCTTQVNVVDNASPVVQCPNPVTVNANAGVCYATIGTAGNLTPGNIAGLQDGEYADNCTVARITWSANNGASPAASAGTGINTNLSAVQFQKGVTTVNYTLQDAALNTPTVCSFTVTVNDNQAPVAANCPPNITVNANIAPGCAYKKPNSQMCIADANVPANQWCGSVNFTDNCDGASTVSNAASLTQTYNLGANPITITKTDASGNTGTCTFTITVVDQTPPTTICQNITRSLSATFPGSVSVNAENDIDDSSFDNCYLDLIYEIKKGTHAANTSGWTPNVTFTCSELGAQVVTLRVTEDGGTKSSTATCTVTVQDNTAPTVNCPGTVSINLLATGLNTLNATSISASATDNCATPPTLVGIRRGNTGSFTSGIQVNCADVVTNFTAQLQFSDGNGNTPTCSFTVDVNDVTPPSLSISNSGVVVNCASPFTPPAPTPVYSDACGVNTASFAQVGTTTTVPGSCPGNYTLISTYQVADIHGNTAQSVFSVSVVDNIPPVITTPTANTTLNLSNFPSTCTPTASYTATLSDNCTPTATLNTNATWSIDYPNVSGTNNASGTGTTATGNFPTGVSVITFNTTDNCGNTVLKTLAITVVDNVAPKFDATFVNTYCPTPNTIFPFSNTAGTCGYTFVWNRPYPGSTITDCAWLPTPPTNVAVTETIVNNGTPVVPSQPYNPNAPTFFPAVVGLPVGANLFTYTASDGLGNTATCSFTVQVNDVQAPTLTCPSTVTLNTICPTSTVPDFRTNQVNAFDNCQSSLTISQTKLGVALGNLPMINYLPTPLVPEADPADGSEFEIVFTAFDGFLTSVPCTTRVVLNDADAPIPTVQGNLPTLTSDCGFAIVNAPTAFPNCGTTPLIYGTPGGIQATPYTVVNGEVTQYQVLLPIGANCLQYAITWSYDDGNGNVSTQDQQLILCPDVDPPTVSCNFQVSPLVINLNAMGTASITPAMIGTASDPDMCGTVLTALNQSTFGCADLALQTVTFTATDNGGNTATCTAKIKVQDILAPVMPAAPANITVECGLPLVEGDTIFANDNCKGIFAVIPADIPQTNSSYCDNNVDILRTWIATDNSGNQTVITQGIIVKDTKKPVWVLGSAVEIEVETDLVNPDCNKNVALEIDDELVYDTCVAFEDLIISRTYSGPGFTPATGCASGACASGTYAVGTHTMVFTAQDPCGNSSTQTIVLNVIDAAAPSAVCINGISITLNANGQAVVTPEMADNGSTDNCDDDNVFLFLQELTAPNGDTIGDPSHQLVFGCGEADGETQYPIVLWVVDDAGNASFCETYVVVQDNVAPVLTCPANKTVTCETNIEPSISIGFPSAVDNCASLLEYDYIDTPENDGYTCGNVVRTWYVVDQAGNTATCVQSFTIIDNKPPKFVDPLPLNDTIACGEFASDTILLATDNCTPQDSIVILYEEQITPNSGASGICAQKYNYTTTRTWTAIDYCGNTAVHSQTLVVRDTVAPLFNFPQGDTIQVLSANFAPTTNCTAPVALNLAQFMDECALLTECTINSISFSPTLVNPITPNVLDVSGNYPIGLTKVKFSITDPCGNTGVDSVYINVVDNSTPIVICNNNVVIALGNNGQASIEPADIDLNSSDNCGIDTYELSQTEFDCQDLGFQPVTMTVTDIYGNANSCTVTVEVTADSSAIFDVTTASQAPSYFGGADGKASVTASGGSNNFTYMWSNSATTSQINNVPAGIYTVTITDAFTNCQRIETIVITDGPKVKITVGHATGSQNTLVQVPVYASNFVDISGFSFSIDLNNLAVGAIANPISISNVNPAFASGTFNATAAPNGSTIGILYLSSGANVNLTPTNNALLFNLNIQLSGAAIGTTSTLTVDGSPVPFQVLRNFAVVPADTMIGSVTITLGLNEYDIVGDIYHWKQTVSPFPVTPVKNVAVALTGGVTENDTTDLDGEYFFLDIPANTNTLATPSKSQSGNQNINIIDQGLLLNHIFATVNKPSPLTSPYQRVAADVNFDGNIDIIDFALIQRLLLGTVQNLEGQSAKDWVFIPSDYTFPATATEPYPNPVYTPLPMFPRTIDHSPIIQDELDDDFVGVRMADLNGDGPIPLQQEVFDDRSGALIFKVEDRAVEAGETFQVEFKAKDFNDRLGYQFTLGFDPNALELQNIETGALEGLDADMNFGTARLIDGLLSTAWVNTEAMSVADDATVFTLSFKAAQPINAISNVLNANADVVSPMSIVENGTIQPVNIEFTTNTTTDAGLVKEETFALYQNQPNPFNGVTTISFRLPRAERATVQVYNANGQVVRTMVGQFDKGYNTVQFRRTELGAPGVYYYEVSTAGQTARKKMILID